MPTKEAGFNTTDDISARATSRMLQYEAAQQAMARWYGQAIGRHMMFATRDDYNTRLAFDFFYRVGRLEYALKVQRFVKARRDGSAEVDWECFIDQFADAYKLSANAEKLMGSPPRVQVLVGAGVLSWVRRISGDVNLILRRL